MTKTYHGRWKNYFVAIYTLLLLSGCGEKQQSTHLPTQSPEATNHASTSPSPPKSAWPLFPAQKNGKFGYINKTGDVIIPFQYAYVSKFSENLAVFKADQKYGYLDKDGSVVIAPQFSGASNFSDGLAAIRVGAGFENSYGFIDKLGKIVIHPAFSRAEPFLDGYAFVQQGTKMDAFWIDKSGKKIGDTPPNRFRIETIYVNKRVGRVTEDVLRYRLRDNQRKLAIPTTFDDISIVKKDELFSFCKDSEVYATEYSIGTINAKCALYGSDGKMLTDYVFKQIGRFNEGIAGIAMGGKVVSLEFGVKKLQGESWGFIDETGKLIINPQFDGVRQFSEGLAAVNSGGKWGYIDRSGKVVIAMLYESASDFHNGLALVDSTIWIDKYGAVIFKGSDKPAQSDHAPSSDSEHDAKLARSSSVEKLSKVGTGTMFVVSKDGYAVTNNHVINGCKKLLSTDSEIQIITTDAVNDLALIKKQGNFTSAALLATDPAKVRQGEDIIVFGFPLNFILSSGGNLTPGVVSAISGIGNNSSQIQITASIQPGSSGSPVLNKKGEVVGVVSMKLSDSKMAKATGSIGQNLNFAVSGQTLKSFLDANKVQYKTGGLLSFEKSTVDIAEDARKWTTIIECWK